MSPATGCKGVTDIKWKKAWAIISSTFCQRSIHFSVKDVLQNILPKKFEKIFVKISVLKSFVVESR